MLEQTNALSKKLWIDYVSAHDWEVSFFSCCRFLRSVCTRFFRFSQWFHFSFYFRMNQISSYSLTPSPRNTFIKVLRSSWIFTILQTALWHKKTFLLHLFQVSLPLRLCFIYGNCISFGLIKLSLWSLFFSRELFLISRCSLQFLQPFFLRSVRSHPFCSIYLSAFVQMSNFRLLSWFYFSFLHFLLIPKDFEEIFTTV